MPTSVAIMNVLDYGCRARRYGSPSARSVRLTAPVLVLIPVFALAVASGATVIVAPSERTIWQDPTPQLIPQLGHSDNVLAVAISPDGQWILTDC